VYFAGRKKWDAGKRDYLLWPPETRLKLPLTIKITAFVRSAINHYPKTEYFSAPMNVVMSAIKYKYMTPNEKKRVLEKNRR